MHDRFSSIGITEYETNTSQRRNVINATDPVQEAEDRLLSSLSNSASDSAFSLADQENWDRFAGFALGLGCLYVQDAISYPFTTIRRQCQVNHSSLRYQLSPVSVFKVIWRIRHNQGIGALWKGGASTYLVQGVVVASEIGISECMNLQREPKKEQLGYKDWISHQMLKSLAMLSTMPFYSASLVDSVQSLEIDDGRTVFTFLKDAIYRLIGWYNSRGHGRLLPFYLLIAPTLFHGMLHYQLKMFIEKQLYSYLSKSNKNVDKYFDKFDMNNQTSKLRIPKAYYCQIVANFVSSLLADIILYPLETVVARLHVQGTRTIIDDTDNGDGVVPLCTNYDGFADCFRCIKREEGYFGFYKGFGSLILQYTLQAVIIKLMKSLFLNIDTKLDKNKTEID